MGTIQQEAVKIEQVQVDRYAEDGTSLDRAIRWIIRTIIRGSYPGVVGWRAIFKEARCAPKHR